MITHFNIVDRNTGIVVATAKNRVSANKAVDRRDNKYGAYRFSAVAVWKN